jgi:hypothetical protein
MQTKQPHEIVIDGKLYETADAIKERVNCGETTIRKLSEVVPPSMRICRRRYFERNKVQQWLLSLTT